MDVGALEEIVGATSSCTRTAKVSWAISPAESIVWTVALTEPSAVGVQVRMPVSGSIYIPTESTTLQTMGSSPCGSVAVKVNVYGMPWPVIGSMPARIGGGPEVMTGGCRFDALT